MHKVSGITIIIIITLLCSALCDQKKVAKDCVVYGYQSQYPGCSRLFHCLRQSQACKTFQQLPMLICSSLHHLIFWLLLPCPVFFFFFNEPLLLKGKEKNPSNSIPRKLYECNPFEDPARYFWLSSFYMKGNSRLESKQAHLFSTEAMEKDA